MSEDRKIRNDIFAVGILALIIFLAASLATYDTQDPAHNASSLLNKIYQPDQLYFPARAEIHNACGKMGAWTSDMLTNTLGIGAYFLLAGLIALEIALFKRQSLESPWLKTTGWTLSLLAITTLANQALPSHWFSPIIGPGGYLGALGGGLLGVYVGSVGCFVIALTTFFVGMMMCTEYLVFRTGRVVFAPALVAASAVLPFGIVHRCMTWFNGEAVDEEEYVAQDDIEDDENAEDQGTRTIRFKRHDIDRTEEEEIGGDALVAESDSGEEDSEEYEDENHLADDEAAAENESEFEEVEEQTGPIKIASHTKELDPAASTTEAADEVAEAVPSVPKPHFKIRKPKPEKAPSEREVVMSQLDAASSSNEVMADYDLPAIEMLEVGDAVPFEQQKREALKKAQTLEATCKEFKFDVKVVEIETGPVISQYEIDLAPGLRVQKITALADDLAIGMKVPSVRVVAPIPGKNSVGVEVPNETRQVVRLRQVMEQSEKQIQKMKIPLFLGTDAVGAPMVADLAKLPHLLIAGRTGTGKSVCLNAIIASILMTRKPEDVRMLMIDPKMVELSGYGELPHLMHPVVTDMRKAEAILAWAVDKMEERYTLLAKVGVRHVTTFNELSREEVLERMGDLTEEEQAAVPNKMPFIVIIADEMADLMMTAGKDVEQHIIRLAQKSRAVGIHLILATQKPTVDVITGLIKSNLPARISFQVASKTDSRVVLDASGADKLLGMGDMLFLWPGTSNLLRGQGTYLSDPEIDMITETVSTGEQNFVHELVNIKVKSNDEDADDAPKQLENRDPLYEQAISVVVKEQRGSCSLLQRAMQIGYGRAARLIDFMAEDGYVGDYNGSKAREVLLTEAQWANIQSGDPNPVNDEDWPDEEPEVKATVAPALKPKKAKPAPAKPKTRQPKPVARKPIRPAEIEAEESESQEDRQVYTKQDPGSSGIRRPKLKRLRKLEPGTTSHTAANVFPIAPSKSEVPPEDNVEDVSEDEELEDDEEYEDDEYEDDDEVESLGDDDEYEYEDDEEDEEYEDYDEDDYEDVD